MSEKKTTALDAEGSGEIDARRAALQEPPAETERSAADMAAAYAIMPEPPAVLGLATSVATTPAEVASPGAGLAADGDQATVLRSGFDVEGDGARIIPFVPKGGFTRTAPLPAQVEMRFSRPAAGSASAGSPETPFSLPPAQPPPPSGFRRAPGWVRGDSEPAPPVHVDAGLPGGGEGSGIGPALGGVRAFLGRLSATWSWRRGLKIAVLGFVALVLAYASLVVMLAIAYRWVNPPMSSLMLTQRLAGAEISQTWVPIERISPHLLQAVILSEDGQFCRHRGVDWLAMKEAIEQSLDGNARGGSTISMQTVKNLFLWPSKSYVRKAIELPLAMGSEMAWSKPRMLEIYLNIAEWGPGVFGAEAAARYHFGKPASNLNAREASLLAVSLPNPIERQAGQPSMGSQRMAERLQARMRRATGAAACVAPGRGNRAG